MNAGHGCRNVKCVSLAECSSLLFLEAHSEATKTSSCANTQLCKQHELACCPWLPQKLHTKVEPQILQGKTTNANSRKKPQLLNEKQGGHLD